MNSVSRFAFIRRWLLPAPVCCVLFGPTFAPAQTVAPDAVTLARYDTNKNGRLDPDELAAMEAAQAKAVRSAESAVTSRTPGDRDADSSAPPVVELSPFEVIENARGYFSANTMSGTRFSSKLEDLASSITVITKEQMSDFAMLDINDVFLYTANTEGTGDYTAFSVDSDGNVSDGVSTNPNSANRMRGVGSANISFGNYKMSGLTPVDPLSIDGVEVSRGPNANIFGLGGAGGTLNMVPATANLQRNRTESVA